VHSDFTTGCNITLHAGAASGYYSFEGAVSGATMTGAMLNPSHEKVGSFVATKDGPPQPTRCKQQPVAPPVAPPVAVHLTTTGDPTEMALSWGELLPGTTAAPQNVGPPG
jgi:hypothetical protein